MIATATATEPPRLLPVPSVEVLGIDEIRPSPHNPRLIHDGDPELASLAQSIAAKGVLQPILVRPVDRAGLVEFELIAGERRWRAARAAGRLSIPAIVRHGLTEHEALELTVTENLQRENLHPLEEANGVAALVGAGEELAAIADRLGKPVSWVARRSRLAKLSPKWRALATNPKREVSRWPASMLELVARLEVPAQDAFLAEYPEFDEDLDRGDPTDEGWLRRAIAECTRELRFAPWKTTDELLVPEAGACTTCPKRSSCHPGLFDDEPTEGKRAQPGDRCLDAVCWSKKADRFLEQKVAELESNGTQVAIELGYHRDKKPAIAEGRRQVHEWQGTQAKKGTPGAVAVVVASGEHAGQVKWRTFGRSEGDTTARTAAAGEKPKPKVKPLAERRKMLEARRRAHALDSICTAVEKAKPPKVPDLVVLAAAFGTAHTNDRPGNEHDTQGKKAVGVLTNPSAAVETLWRATARVIARRWRYSLRVFGVQALTARQPEIDDVARRLGLDLKPYAAAAARAIPEPKSWSNLEASGKPKAKPVAAKKAKAV